VCKSVYLLITILVFKASCVNGSKSNELHIGGIFPIMGKGGWQGGQGELTKIYLLRCDQKQDFGGGRVYEICYLFARDFRGSEAGVLKLSLVEREIVKIVKLSRLHETCKALENLESLLKIVKL
jgi:hypothetical protein